MWARLEIIDKIGEGGMGEVLKVYDRSRGAIFAAKRLLPNLARDKDVKRFTREIENLQILSHPNIVRIVDYSPPPEPGYLMEYCPGGSVANHAPEFHGNTALCEALFRSMCEALAFAHGTKTRIVHRDIKPGNILLGADKKYKLSDFGLSVQLEGNQPRLTSSNWFSPGFSSPEQLRNFAGADERSDVFSLGATILHMYTGVTYDAPAVPEIPEPLARVLEVCLYRLPKKRPINASAAAEFLDQAKSSDPGIRFPALRRADQLNLIAKLIRTIENRRSSFPQSQRAKRPKATV
jgi:serine/threonine protein kinase